MKGTKRKWIRYFNIILGIPNKKQRTSGAGDNSYTERSIEPASRQINLLREQQGFSAWQLKADYNSAPVIQHCEGDF